MDPSGIQIFVQNTSTWRGGQHLSAEKKTAAIKWEGSVSNLSFRIDFRGLERVIAGDRRVSRKSLFIAANEKKLPLHDWDILEATKAFDKDDHRLVQELTVDMGTLRANFCLNALVNGSDNPKQEAIECARESSRVYCIVSAGIGLKEVIKAVLNSGFKVELYFWRGGCSPEYEKMAKEYSLSLKIVFLDELLDEVGMETYKFEEGELPPARTYVLRPHPNIGQNPFKAAYQKLHSQFSSYVPIQLFPSQNKNRVYLVLSKRLQDTQSEIKLLEKIKEEFSPYGTVVTLISITSHSKAYQRESQMVIRAGPSKNMFTALNGKEEEGEGKRCWMREFCDRGFGCNGHHTEEEKVLFQANDGQSPYKLNRPKVYFCPLMGAGRTCRLFTCQFSHKKHHSFCCQCATTHNRDWETNGACQTKREEIVTPTWAAKLLEDGCILGDFEGPFLHVRDFSRVFDVRLSTICFHREFCTHQDCAFFHTEEEKELFEKNGGISPYRLSKRGLSGLCHWCAQPHPKGPEFCPLRGKVRKLPITPEKVAELEEQRLLLGPSSSPPSPSLPSVCLPRPDGDGCFWSSPFPLPEYLKRGSYLLIDNSNSWIGGRGEAQKRCGPLGDWRIDHSKLKKKILNGEEECRTVLFGSDPNATAWEKFRQFGMEVVVTERSSTNNRECFVDNLLTQYLCEDSAALDECLSLFQGMGSQAREFMEGVNSSRLYCVVSGDKGYLEAIKWVLARGLRVRVYAWESGCAMEYKEMKEEARNGKWEGRFDLVLLDGWFDEIKERVFEGKEVESQQKENLPVQQKPADEGGWKDVGELNRKKRVAAFRRKQQVQKKRGTRHCPHREGCVSYGSNQGCKYFHTKEEEQLFQKHGRKSPYITIISPFCWTCLKPHKMDQKCYHTDRPMITEAQEQELVAAEMIRQRGTVYFN